MLNFTQLNANSIFVDSAALGGAVPASVKYAWGVIDCCNHTDPDVYVTKPCGSLCPIMSTSGLPANPFLARINTEGSCECVAPQVCGAAI